MNGKDKISVIIPCYNVQKYIMRCFDSIYSQTYGFENLEVILIDDLSTDNTWSILESLQRQYPENVISLKIQKKGKCGGARNLGMDICTGKYITFVDADDYVHPDMLRVLYDRMTEDDYDVAQCGVSCFKADKPNVLEVNDFEIQRLDLDNVDNRKNLIIGLTGFTNVTAWAKLYSTKFIIEHNLRFIEDVYYEDTHFSIPQYWSVRADGLNGAIYDNKTKKANIYFKNPIEKRMVSRVEWIDRNNTVYRIDYYNKYGYMYCSENVSGGNVTVREFYDRNGDIKVLEQTGPKTYTTFGTRISPKSYRGFADYLEAYLKYNKIYDENIWLTSDEILNKFAWDYGNFKISYLPQNRLNSDLTVITQTNTAFRILCSEEQQVNWYKDNSNCKCDRLYSYLENNKSKFGKKEAFIITETDQLEYIEQLINDFPEITFHIAASTIMSDKLTKLDINNNVELYPCITEQKIKELFERCDIYLDINHYRELYNAVNQALINNMIILAFDNTVHSKELYPIENIFDSSNYVNMKETLKNIITSRTIFNEYIDRQKMQLKQLAAKVVMGDTDESI